MSDKFSRREFVKGSVSTSAGLALTAMAAGSAAAADDAAPAKNVPSPDALPAGKIGDLEVSRLLLGGNLLTHYTHSRDLKYVYSLAKHYNTEEKILETLATAEENGINTLVVHNVPSTMEILRTHRERGGKMQWITCTFHALAGGDLAKFGQQVEQLVDYGTDGLYISGVEADNMCGYHNAIFGPTADERVGEPKLDVIGQALNMCKAHGLTTGIGAHRLGVIQDCEKAGIDADFYVKTFHHHRYPSVVLNHDSRWCSQPEEVSQVMQQIKKPWIAYKVMAAGAIPPRDAFKYAFSNGADYVLAGMFDFEIAQDVLYAKEAIAQSQTRLRPWCA
ncbi:MAG: hypothetical protein ACC628_14325 [Pirellulaceae bacterium]